MTTPTSSIACFLVASLLGALGQYLYKAGADRSSGTLAGYVLNPYLLAGVVCYIAVMVLFVVGFKRGGSMSVLYPLYATTFIWGAIISRIAFGVPIRPINIAGMAFLVLGMYFMGSKPT